MRRPLMMLMLVAAGCTAALSEYELPSTPVAAGPTCDDALFPLAAATGIEPTVVVLPSLPDWPIVMKSEGPIYASIQYSPLVFQGGVLKDSDRAEDGSGYGVVVGYKLLAGGTITLGFEGIYETSAHHNPTSDVPGTATRTSAAARVTFRGDAPMHPFAAAGVGDYALVFDGLESRFNLAGPGAFLSAGVDYAAARHVAGRLEVAFHAWDAVQESGTGGMAQTLAVSLGLAVSF